MASLHHALNQVMWHYSWSPALVFAALWIAYLVRNPRWRSGTLTVGEEGGTMVFVILSAILFYGLLFLTWWLTGL